MEGFSMLEVASGRRGSGKEGSRRGVTLCLNLSPRDICFVSNRLLYVRIALSRKGAYFPYWERMDLIPES